MAGRKPREMQSTPPQRGFYLIEWEINELIRWSGVSDLALRLWLTLKGLSWQTGRCDPTDEWLADWLGGVSQDTVRRSRRELEASHLLLTHSDNARRWLTPVPVTRGLRDKLPAPIASQVDAADAALCELIRRKEATGRVALPPPAGGVNSIDVAAPVKHHVTLSIKNKKDDDVREGGAGGTTSPATAALAAYLQGMGAYPVLATRLAGQLLTQMNPDEARVYAQAHRIALLENPPRGKRELARDDLVRLWVSRLRDALPVSAAMTARARAALLADQQADGPPAAEDIWCIPPEERAGEEGAEETDDAPFAPPEDAGPRIECDYLGAPRVLTVAALWEEALGQLSRQMTRSTFELCLMGTRGVGLSDDGALVVEVAGENAAQVLRVRLHKVVARVLHPLVGRDLPVTFRVRE